MPLTEEEKQKIVEEERLRAAERSKYNSPQQVIVKQKKSVGCLSLIIVLIIIGVIASLVLSALGNARDKANQAREKSVSVQQPVTKPVFDIPSLVGKNMTEIKAIIGNPTGAYSEPTTQQLALDPKTWTSEWDKDGQDLSIEYEVKTLEVINFFISTDDPSGATKDTDRLLKIGNLTRNDPRYKVEFVSAIGDPTSYTGVKIIPK